MLKEIEVTNSFLGMAQDAKKCQNEETLHNCTTIHYINIFLKQCKCLPFSLKVSSKVYMESPLCSSEKLACILKVKKKRPNCLVPCTGTLLTSFSNSIPENKYLETKICSCYDKHQKWLPLPSVLKGSFYTFIFSCCLI